ncbi:lipid droplet-associated protein [Labedaea rhizosphaerae]|uniref:Lipid droplet-associated protein n=1 Tax=Labedaea rhizosphaerae TaxID=598644 RepID=A0A4R6SLK2_LABRH|nr:lipid droplet-associated protein [Labedaea rhizosphaerae]TDQ04182.1 hypothetical protein EV186_101124 [Labedaea rhizosphaerae]
MNPLPLPLRVAAGLAATAVERARELPTKLAGLPVTVASQALQLSMRVQQHVTELAIKGDETLSVLRPVEQTPEWATFDEDSDQDDLPESFGKANDSAFDRAGAFEGFGDADDSDQDQALEVDQGAEDDQGDPWKQEERAIAEEVLAPPIEGYDDLSLPQLRARLRAFSPEQLSDLLAYERAGAARPAFIGMLTRRIATVRDQT